MNLKSTKYSNLHISGIEKKSIQFFMLTCNRSIDYNKYLFPLDAEYFLSKEDNFDKLSFQFDQMLAQESAKMKNRINRRKKNVVKKQCIHE